MKHFLGLLIAASFAISCDDDDNNTTIDDARVGLEMRATTTQSQINGSARTQESGLVFREVLLGVTELEFETEDENLREDDQGERDDDDIEFEGRYTVDLVNGTSTPDFGMADIKPGLYEEIEFEVAGLLDDGASVFIAFDRPAAPGDTTRVEYSSRESFEIEIEDDKGFQLNDDTNNNVLVLFELDRLFETIDLSQATADDDGVIRINADSNAAIANQIRDNFDDAFEAGDDDDDDDRFDDDDDDDDGD